MKNRKINLYSFLTGMLAALMLVSVMTPALAAAYKTIDVLTGVKVYVDDKEIRGTDSAGNPVDAFIFDGVTYLPVRAISEAVGKGVQWDPDTQSVYLGKHNGSELPVPEVKGLDLIDRCTVADKCNDHSLDVVTSKKNQIIRLGDDAVNHWIRMPVRNYVFSTWEQKNVTSDKFVTYNLNGEYDALTLKAYSSYDTYVTIYNNNTKDSVLGSFKVIGNAAPAYYTVPINRAFQIRIDVAYDKKVTERDVTKDDYIYLYNATLK